MSNGDRMTEGSRGTEFRSMPPSNRRRNITPEREWLSSHHEGYVADYSRNGYEIRLILWNFDIDSWNLKNAHQNALRRFAESISVGWAVTSRIPIHLIGRASDSVPALPMTNQELSLRRAMSVKEFLRRQNAFRLPLPSNARLTRPFDPTRLLHTQARGSGDPLNVSGDSAKKDAYNRSVEILLNIPRARPCEFRSLLEQVEPPVLRQLLLPYISENENRVIGGQPVAFVIEPGRGSGIEGKILVTMCCSRRSSERLGVIFLLPDNPDYFRRYRDSGPDLSSRTYINAFRALNNAYIRIAKANPCITFSSLRSQVQREMDRDLKQLLEGIVRIFGGGGGRGILGDFIKILAELLG